MALQGASRCAEDHERIHDPLLLFRGPSARPRKRRCPPLEDAAEWSPDTEETTPPVASSRRVPPLTRKAPHLFGDQVDQLGTAIRPPRHEEEIGLRRRSRSGGPAGSVLAPTRPRDPSLPSAVWPLGSRSRAAERTAPRRGRTHGSGRQSSRAGKSTS